MADRTANAKATLTFDIDEKGTPANIRVDKSTGDEWSGDVTDALRKWKYTPALKDGQPVSTSCTMDFVRGN